MSKRVKPLCLFEGEGEKAFGDALQDLRFNLNITLVRRLGLGVQSGYRIQGLLCYVEVPGRHILGLGFSRM